MPFNFGAGGITTLKCGSDQVTRAYLGTALVWESYVAPVVAMPDVSDYKEGQVGTVSVGLTLYSNGTFAVAGGQGAGPNSGTWRTAGAAGDVEVYATFSGGAGASWSATAWNTWTTLGDFYVSLSRTTNGTSTGTVGLTFRNKTTGATLDTASITLDIYRGIIA